MIITPFAYMAEIGPTPANIYIDAVLAAGGTLSGAQETAIQTFYSSLDTAGIYSKMYAMYPFLGGVAASNAIEFVNPGGGFDLTFTGTWTHNNLSGSTCTPSVANYANTSFNPTTDAVSVTTDFSFGLMIVGGAVQGYHGLGQSGAANNYIIVGTFGQVDMYFGQGTGNFAGNPAGFTIAAFEAVSRTLSNSWYGAYTNSGPLTTVSKTNAYTTYNGDIHLGRINGLGSFAGGGQLRFGFIGKGLNTTEMEDLADYANTLQTAFSRNIW